MRESPPARLRASTVPTPRTRKPNGHCYPCGHVRRHLPQVLAFRPAALGKDAYAPPQVIDHFPEWSITCGHSRLTLMRHVTASALRVASTDRVLREDEGASRSEPARDDGASSGSGGTVDDGGPDGASTEPEQTDTEDNPGGHGRRLRRIQHRPARKLAISSSSRRRARMRMAPQLVRARR